ncbi:MAG: hypothetical protein WCC27_05040 [Acidobacteriaceae bacterium]
MRSGLDNKRNVVILSVLAVVMVGAVAYFAKSMFGGGSPAPVPTTTAHTEPATAPQASSRNEGGRAAEKLPPLEKLDPTLHPEVMAGAEALEYNGIGRNIFSLVSEPPKIEQVKGPIRPQQVMQPQIAQGPPPPPPIDLKFFGYEAAGGARKAFILHGDDVFIATEGDVVDHHYKVVKITPLSIQVTDLLYNNTQTLALTQS